MIEHQGLCHGKYEFETIYRITLLRCKFQMKILQSLDAYKANKEVYALTLL